MTQNGPSARYPRVEISSEPTVMEMQAIMKPLLDFNAAHGCPVDLEPVAILLKDENELIVGGLWGRTVYQWLFVEHLVVPSEARGQNLGSLLMETAEEIAKKRGCIGSWLTTLSFHAQGFYERLGYEVFAQLPDSPAPHSRILLRKTLTP